MGDDTPSASGWVTASVAAIGLLLALGGTIITAENRYAKAEDVRQQLDTYFQRTIKLRILELDLKRELEPHERALRDHLKRELHEITRD